MNRELYNRVFDENGEIKLCGREACKELIRACEEMTGEVGKFGSTETGFMEPEAIKALFN